MKRWLRERIRAWLGVNDLPPPPAVAAGDPDWGAMRMTTLALFGEKTEVIHRPIKPPKLFDGVLPSREVMANDGAIALDSADVAPIYAYARSMDCNIGFPGYAYLSQLAQRSEYRAPAEVISKEMTRRWIEFTVKDGGDKKELIQKLEIAFKKYAVRDVLREAVEKDNLFGRAQVYIAIKNQENKRSLPLLVDSATIAKGSLLGFKVIEPIWTTPAVYNAQDPTAPDFFKPLSWYVLGVKTHTTRLLMVQSRPVPDILKPAYNFGGMSMSQLMEPYVLKWLSTVKSVNDLVYNFSVLSLKTNMEAALAGKVGGDTELLNRVKLFTLNRSNQGLMLLDKESEEELDQLAVPLSGLDELQAQAQEHMAAPCHIPLVKLTGVTPAGLNANSNGEIQVFYDFVHSEQEAVLEPVLDVILDIIQLSEFGAIDETIDYEFVPLTEPTEKEVAEIRKADADSGVAYIAAGVISPEEERERLQHDPNSGYNNLNGPPPEPITPQDDGEDPPGGSGSGDGP